MKIKTTTEILDLAGAPIPEGKGNLTLKTVLTGALMGQLEGARADGGESVKRLNLALRIQEGDEVEMNVDETKMVMDLVGKLYMPLVAGRVWHILDPATK